MSWPEVKLEDLFQITSSKRVFQKDWKSEGVPFYRAREIVKLSKNGFVNNELFISNEMYDEYSLKYGIPEEGDIMVTGVGTLGICYVVKKNDKFYFKDGNIIWFKKNSDVNSYFVEHLFKTHHVRKQIDNSAGSTVGTYTISKAKNTVIPLPNRKEQDRIVAILDKADEIKSSSKSVSNLRQQLILSTFNEMFGDLRINSKSWPEKSIFELCNRVNVGYVGPLTPLYVESGIRCLRGLNIKRGRISSDNIKQISPESHENLLKKSRLNAGDVVAIRTGNAGVSAVISEEYDDVNCADLIIMTPTSEIEASYLCEFLNQKFGDADSIQGAVGAIQKHFNIGSAKKVMVPLPPLKLQNEYTRLLGAITRLDNQIEFAEKTSLSLAQDLLAH